MKSQLFHQNEFFSAALQAFPTTKPALIEKAAGHASLVLQYRTKTNLIFEEDANLILLRHTLDSLQASRVVEAHGGTATLWIDMGSGAGFPVVPLACIFPEMQFLSIEPRSHRVAFLRICAKELKLDNLTIMEGRIEDTPTKLEAKASYLSSRALSDLETDWKRGRRFLTPDGLFVTFKSLQEVIPSSMTEQAKSIPYNLPGIGHGFQLITLRNYTHG